MEPKTVAIDLVLVSDDLIFPSRVREGIRPLSGRVRVVSTAEAALQAARNPPRPRAILLNLTARRYDPVALIAAFKADPETKNLPLIAFAGHAETEKHRAAREAGADRTVANSSVALHLPQVLRRLLPDDGTALPPDRADDILEIDEASDER
ncbi:MAG: hypothetical protein SFU56_06835 [Capsulimonadales bacterium]|nr:hypothetical protein [Capsulimonadales bacterium]